MLGGGRVSGGLQNALLVIPGRVAGCHKNKVSAINMLYQVGFTA